MGKAATRPFTRDSYKPPWNQPFDLYLDQAGQPDPRCRRSIVLYGMAGSGKTSRALCEWERPLLCACIEDVREATWAGPKATTHLVFDEADFSNLAAEDCINLLDSSEIHSLPARYENVKLPAIPRIFLTNRPMRWGVPRGHIFPAGASVAQNDAIQRRFRSFEVVEPMYPI
jgi:hypothetical protein